MVTVSDTTIVLAPTSDYVAFGQGSDEWNYTPTFSLKSTAKKRFGSVIISKKLDQYNSAFNTASFVYSVVGTIEGEVVFDNVYTIDFDRAGTKTKQIATTEFVSSAVAAALAKITGIKFEVVTELPASGVDGVFYLLSHTHSDEDDGYDEYVWLSGKSKYEKIGNTDVDLSGYIKSSDILAIANTDIDAICA